MHVGVWIGTPAAARALTPSPPHPLPHRQPIDTPWGRFGTRSQTVLACWRDGRVELRERSLERGDGGDSSSWTTVRHAFQMPRQPDGGSGGGDN